MSVGIPSITFLNCSKVMSFFGSFIKRFSHIGQARLHLSVVSICADITPVGERAGLFDTV